ncbi:hypothetical protein ABZ619_38655 [Streptomyces sp. NPDC007851]|uniref:hypothetical protein n=1 Tax=Streptomyces sp. NPDC007851 TaxID=3155008 RepID=UPI0033D9549F
MTVLGAPAAPARFDAGQIRRTYCTVLGQPRVGLPDLGGEEHRAHLAGLLRGQLQQLLEEVGDDVTWMRGETRETADYVLGRGRSALAWSYRETREPDRLQDLAALTRALLTLHCMGSLCRGEPTGEEPTGPYRGEPGARR